MELKYYCDKHRHLVCTPFSVENLHLMAANLKIKKCWFHTGVNPHYDIPKRSVNKITKLCEVVSSKEIWNIINNKALVLF